MRRSDSVEGDRRSEGGTETGAVSGRAPLSTQILAIAFCLAVLAGGAAAQSEPAYLSDRGPGIPTSLFGTYIRSGEWLVYPFVEYIENDEDEYKPSELGFVGDTDFLGHSEEWEALLFIGYGLSDRVALEFEAAIYTEVSFEKAPEDTSGVPALIEESGLGEIEAQVRWRWSKETERRPERYSFVEVAFPFQKNDLLIGAQDWEVGYGFGVVRGYEWGTLNARMSIAYEAEESQVELGEYALEYLKRTSARWRWVATIEGEDDEVSLITEAQWHLSDRVFVKLNNGLGLTEKAPDVAPEVGVMLSF